jgi:hypothetical protein
MMTDIPHPGHPLPRKRTQLCDARKNSDHTQKINEMQQKNISASSAKSLLSVGMKKMRA